MSTTPDPSASPPDRRVVLVTGAASGIGAATARRFAADGAAVVCTDRDGAGATAVAASLPDALGMACDVTDPDAVTATVEAAVAFGGRLDVVVSSAGVAQFGHVDDLSLEEWNRTLAVNLTGTFLVCQGALPHLRASRGSIVNVASIGGLRGGAYTAAYSASKGGVVLLTKSLAVELSGDGVRVNCVCPGAVDTPLVVEVAHKMPADVSSRLMHRTDSLLRGLVAPDQVADAIAWLASAGAGMVTGVALPIDGGMQS